ncbi:MAG: di-trans,poly-cis-decaprenylcistransferase [Chlamydiia bacterium]|nr:di-trans,poly-cis-decaprenylcistransferase [Chlamydiia bacterium]
MTSEPLALPPRALHSLQGARYITDSHNPFSENELSVLNLTHLPQHVAIIMDGNRRWAKQRGLPPMLGHWEGAEVLTDVISAAAQLGIKTITVYSFSTENWQRSGEEIESLMDVFEIYLTRKREPMILEGIRLDMIGDLSGLPQNVQNAFLATRQATEHCRKINLVLAINYGARDEIRRAFAKLLALHQKQGLRKEDLTEELIASQLDTSKWGDPELLIRTSGEMRMSNFLLWQISYAEIYVTEKLWPDFSPTDLLEAVIAYQKRKKRLGI